MAVQSSTRDNGGSFGRKHTQDYETYDTTHSDDIGAKDFGGRNTDRLGEWQGEYEQNYNLGGHNSGGTNEIKNQATSGTSDKYGPTNVPKHLNG